MDYFDILGPLVRTLPAEQAHSVTVWALQRGLVPSAKRVDESALKVKLWDLEFPNPVGMAAGFDKNAQVVDALFRLGFGFVEVGTVTPRPQPGNPKPRMFRLTQDGAVINRLGFNNRGIDAMAATLQAREYRRADNAAALPGVLGVNVGKNKDSQDATADYVAAITRLAPLAGYLVVNVSSPNTPGLRALQSKAALSELLSQARQTLQQLQLTRTPPLLVKIAPDLGDADKQDIVAVLQEGWVDGLIVSNTTVDRPTSLQSSTRSETGGLSGKPLFAHSTHVLREMAQALGGSMPIIGVGGIASGADAYEKILAGASLIQLYTALVYQGPRLIREINTELYDRMRADGFTHISQAVGTGRK